MKKLLILSFMASMLLFIACDKTETFDDTRRIDNEEQFAKISRNSEYKKLESKTGEGFIMYKVIEEGVSEEKPLFNDKVKVQYTGWYKHYWTRDDEFTGDDGNTFKNKLVFDTTELDEGKHVTREFTVNGTVDGYATALQHMNVGDKWEIWIPWKLGYGGGYGYTSSSRIPEYTTLCFEIKLVGVVK